MKRKGIIIGGVAVLVLIGAALFYFLYLNHPSRRVLATVNTQKITGEDLEKELAKVESPLKEMYREEPAQLLDGIITKELLLQEAKRQNLSPPVKTFKDASKDNLSPEDALIAELMKKKFASPPEVTQKEIEAFYKMFKDRMEGKPLKQMAPIIEQFIRETKQQEEMGRFIDDLRKNAKIEIHQDRIQKIAAKPPEANTEEDLKKALASGKPVLVDFGANSCLPCRQLRPILKEVEKEYSEKASVLVIDVYKNQKLAQEYKILLIPTLVFFDGKGKEAFRHVGVLDKEKIATKLKEIGMGT
jgi:thioredoxin 1